MDESERQTREVLQVLAERGSLDYAPKRNGVLLFQNNGEWMGRDPSEFSSIRELNLIELSESMGSGHSVFHGRVDKYRISEKGRKYLEESNEH